MRRHSFCTGCFFVQSLASGRTQSHDQGHQCLLCGNRDQSFAIEKRRIVDGVCVHIARITSADVHQLAVAGCGMQAR